MHIVYYIRNEWIEFKCYSFLKCFGEIPVIVAVFHSKSDMEYLVTLYNKVSFVNIS